MADKSAWESSYAKKLRDPRWQKLRLLVFERDNWTCQLCGGTESTLHVHHAAYCPWSADPWDTEISVLFTACVHCHSREHKAHKECVYDILRLLGGCDIRTSLDIGFLAGEIYQELQIALIDRTAKGEPAPISGNEILERLKTELVAFSAKKQGRLEAGRWFNQLLEG